MNTWRYVAAGKRADLYDEGGNHLGIVYEDELGDCHAMFRDPDGKLVSIGGSTKLFYMEAKKLIEITARLNQ